MESKYKERADEILSAHLIPMLNRAQGSYVELEKMKETPEWDCTIAAMCQLAEEVEKVYRDPLMFGEEGSIQRVYTKAYVEELLQEQRELSAEHAEAYIEEYKGGDEQAYVDKDSILNAKLKIK